MMARTVGMFALAAIVASSAPAASAQSSSAPSPAPESVNGSRVVVVATVETDGTASTAAPIESAVIGRLKQAGHRVIDLDQALRSQSLGLADEIASGRVPAALTVLNADTTVAARVKCDKSSDGVLGSDIKAWFCSVSVRALRVSTGDTVHDNTATATVHGLNATMALAGLTKGALAAEVGQLIVALGASARSAAPWALDLTVTRLGSRADAARVASMLQTVEGVTTARLIVFNEQFAKFELGVAGLATTTDIATRLEAAPNLALRVTFEADRTLNASYDFGRAIRQRVVVETRLSETGKTRLPAETRTALPGIIEAALRNLPYIEPTGGSGAGDILGTLTTVAESAKGGGWQLAMTLVGRGTNRALVTAKGSGPDLFSATADATRAFDAAYRAQLTQETGRVALQVPSGAILTSRPAGLTAERFTVGDVFPARASRYRAEGVGQLVVRNTGSDEARAVQVEFRVGDRVVGTQDVGALPGGQARELPVVIHAMEAMLGPGGDSGRGSQIEARLKWQVASVRDATEAFAPIVIHGPNTIGWSEPGTLAAFVTPEASSVRALATTALPPADADSGGLPTRPIRDAAAIFESLWHAPLRYVRDPVPTQFAADIDTVQPAAETLARLAGDCDDLTVLLASLYESVGIATAAVILPGHVLLAVDAETLAGGHILWGLKREAFIEIDGALFVPVEATVVGTSFAEAWIAGAAAIAKAAPNARQIIFFRAAWQRDAPVAKSSGGPSALSAGAPGRVLDPQAVKALADAKPHPAATAMWARLPTSPTMWSVRTNSIAPAARSAFLYLEGNVPDAVGAARVECVKANATACWNAAVMDSLMAALPQDSEGTTEPGSVPNSTDDALRRLPMAVREMLLLRGAGGIADEAGPDAAVRRKLAEALRAAKGKLGAPSPAGATGTTASAQKQTIHVSALGGRKGAQSLSPQRSAFLFFYDTPQVTTGGSAAFRATTP
jgi:hypothetical protein